MKIFGCFLICLFAGFYPAAGQILPGGNTVAGSGRSILTGEVVPKPQLLVEVTAKLWGRLYPEPGVFPGARVEKGQKLAEIILELSAVERLLLDDRTIDIDGFLAVTREKLRAALRDYQRALRIQKENPDFEKEVERRKLIYDNALREFQAASRQQTTQKGVIKSRDPKVTDVLSPLTGYVYQQHFAPGDVNPTDEFMPLFTLVDLSRVWVRVEAYERDRDSLQLGTAVEITSPAYPAETFRGVLRSFGAVVDPATKILPVYYEVPNPDHKLKIGLRVQVRLVKTEMP